MDNTIHKPTLWQPPEKPTTVNPTAKDFDASRITLKGQIILQACLILDLPKTHEGNNNPNDRVWFCAMYDTKFI